jgi:transcriptional regulator with XRE-family HTH domain
MKHIIKLKNVNMVLKQLTSAQIRAARALIRWSADDLARETTLSVTTIRRAELRDNETSLTSANDRAIRQALEAAGVDFIDENGGGPGVRLRGRHKRT